MGIIKGISRSKSDYRSFKKEFSQPSPLIRYVETRFFQISSSLFLISGGPTVLINYNWKATCLLYLSAANRLQWLVSALYALLAKACVQGWKHWSILAHGSSQKVFALVSEPNKCNGVGEDQSRGLKKLWRDGIWRMCCRTRGKNELEGGCREGRFSELTYDVIIRPKHTCQHSWEIVRCFALDCLPTERISPQCELREGLLKQILFTQRLRMWLLCSLVSLVSRWGRDMKEKEGNKSYSKRANAGVIN